MVLLTPDVSNGTESAVVKFSLLILSGVASIMCSARVIMFTCLVRTKMSAMRNCFVNVQKVQHID